MILGTVTQINYKNIQYKLPYGNKLYRGKGSSQI